MNIYEKLQVIQAELKCNKSQYNEFGKFFFRNCEDILEAVKPLLEKTKTVLTLSDNVSLIGERFYVMTVATLRDTESSEFVDTVAYAREEETKKGMDGSQITGASSSYARKYALNGLFAIDDTKDSDDTNNGSTPEEKPQNTAKKKIHLTRNEIQSFGVSNVDSTVQWIEQRYGKLAELTKEQADEIRKKLNAKKAKAKPVPMLEEYEEIDEEEPF